MKLTVNEDSNFTQTEIIINCKAIDENLLRLIASINLRNRIINGIKDEKIYLISYDDIFYFDCVDKKTFIYTENTVYETELKLYEIEKLFQNTGFFRASKSSIINTHKIKNLKFVFSGKVEVLLENNEKLLVSRQYVPILKSILDL